MGAKVEIPYDCEGNRMCMTVKVSECARAAHSPENPCFTVGSSGWSGAQTRMVGMVGPNRVARKHEWLDRIESPVPYLKGPDLYVRMKLQVDRHRKIG